MGKLNIEIQESDFNKKSTSSYQLSILVGMDSFLYLILDSSNKVLLLKDYQINHRDSEKERFSEIRDLIKSEPLFSLLFQKVRIGWQNSFFTIVPSRLFKDSEKKSYLEGLIECTEKDAVLINDLASLNAQLVYSLKEADHQFVKQYFATGKIFHLGASLILGGHQLTNNHQDHFIFLNIRDKHIQVALFEKRTLLLFNEYPFQTAKDAVYFLLLIFSQFKLNTEETPVWLSGKVVEDSELYTLFYRYIRQLNFVPSPAHLSFGKKFDSVPYHFYHDLFSLSLCK